MEFDEAVTELEALVDALEREGDERGLRLLQLVDAVHRPGLTLLAEGDSEHPLARALLAMYDLVQVDERSTVEDALDQVRPYIHSHGGEVELLGVAGGVVRVRLSGACRGCAGSAMTLRRGIEAALRDRFAGFRELVAEEVDAPEPLLQVQRLRRPVFRDAAAVSELPGGALRAAAVDGVPILLASVDGEIYAFQNGCPVDGLPLEGGRLTGSVLVCPWHNCAFDARTGARADAGEGGGLAPVPIAIEDGVVRVAVNVA